jgi:pyruvate dehydrogenase (quinone)
MFSLGDAEQRAACDWSGSFTSLSRCRSKSVYASGAEFNLFGQVESADRSPLRPQMVIRALSDLMPDNAVMLDCGGNTHFAARGLRLRANQRFAGMGVLASIASGLPFAIAVKFAYPGRPSVAIVGDGGFSMLMADLVTAVSSKLPVKIILLKNNSLAEVKFEQQEIGNPEYGCELAPIDFVAAFEKFSTRSRHADSLSREGLHVC